MGTKSGKPKPAKRKLTRRESHFVKAFAKSKSQADAAIAAGYSAKNPDQSAHQALKSIQQKVPDLMDELGLTDRALIENHLVPLLSAHETKFFQHEGKVVQTRKVEALPIRLDALDVAFRLRGSYAPRDVDMTAQLGIKVVIVDVARPARGVVMADVGPGALPPSNGHKPDK